MNNKLNSVDPGGLAEYSVVYTDRSLNHMSKSFQSVMNDISKTLKNVYKAEAVAVVPGSGTFGMEAVARQFANNKHCMVIRNGWFSYRWTQILEMGGLPSSSTVLKARQIEKGSQAAFSPAPIEEVIEAIHSEKPAVVFAPHVETSSGMILPNDYLKQVSQAVHEVGGLFVLDCIASGAIWIDMKELGVDVLISAPQKGWSGSPCCGLVMMGAAALEVLDNTQSSSFSCDLKKWLDIMRAYEGGAHAYHATMPTDSLAKFSEVMREAEDYGYDALHQAPQERGDKTRTLLVSKGINSVAAEGCQAPGVVVNYTLDTGLHNGSKFAAEGMQIAAGVPLQCDEPDDFKTFRIGLFGLDKLYDVDTAVSKFEGILEKILSES
jgi:aspartate aminotransferase-like enzyme